MMRVLTIILGGSLGKLASEQWAGGRGRAGETVSDRKNNKRTMKGSWSDLTTIACSVLTTVMMNSWNKMCFTSDWYFNFVASGPLLTFLVIQKQQNGSRVLYGLLWCDHVIVTVIECAIGGLQKSGKFIRSGDTFWQQSVIVDFDDI